MKLSSGVLVLSIGLALVLGLASPVVAQEPPPPAKEEPAKVEPAAQAPAEEPAKEAPAKEEPATAEPPAEAPAKEEPAKAEPAKETPAKEAAAPKAEAPKDLGACAKSLVPLADSYKKAYDDMQKWIAVIDSQTTAGSEKVKKLQDQIQQNEGAITKAKIDGDDKKAKDLEKQNKQLWSELNAAKKTQAASCGSFTKEAEQRVKQYAADAEAKLKEFEAAAK